MELQHPAAINRPEQGMHETKVRLAEPADAALILEMIHALATFEHERDKVVATLEDIRREGFGLHPAFECLIAESDGRPAGFALFFYNYSTWTGRRGIYLEDLFVQDWARGRGIGEALVRRLAGLALERGCARLDLWVLDWNPARGFYERLGITHMRDWLPYRCSGEALERLARNEPRP
jgi:GNAT superfamily N-acetyltransferase